MLYYYYYYRLKKRIPENLLYLLQNHGFELKTPTVSFKRKGRGSTLSSVELPNFKPFNIFIYYRD
ncbi:hypothetical protein ES288_A12G280400v1 [Gossypium darwinii]|uniref:Uncharacterized protein n=1 Tax=Gossypium darwinii TaxID=34276 RepID=A0A5D2EEF3_GOSDA|nr:hypothetical protein ES288_A12G280400v1 [Gossypium darwinii]